MAHPSSALEPPAAEATIAVLLGASEYPWKPAWSSPVLGTSARGVRDYLLSPTGFGLAPGQVLDLFDDAAGPVDQLGRIKEFLDTTGGEARDLVLYYAGHGGFGNGEYHLGIRNTQHDHEFITRIESTKLAQIIRDGFAHKRAHVILDSCFSASAAHDWHGDAIEVAVRTMSEPSPWPGTAFLAAASRLDVARAPRGQRYTVFTGAILETLTRGVDRAQPRISLCELHEEVRDRLQRRAGPRPELHAPSQRTGDVSRLPLFPNPPYLRIVEASRIRAEAEGRVATEAAARDGGRAHDAAGVRAVDEVAGRADARARDEAAGRLAPWITRVVSLLRPWQLLVIGGAAVAGLGAAGYEISQRAADQERFAVAVQVPWLAGCPADMVHVRGGTFLMGSPPWVGDDEHPQHTVTLRGYCIDRTEVTVAAYTRCVASGKCTAPAEPAKLGGDRLCNGTRGDRQDHPVNCVDWNQAKAYCAWANRRLPSEAEWEYAARGGEGSTYPWGSEAPSARRLNACGSECRARGKQLGPGASKVMYEDTDGWEATAPVGSFPGGASPFGALDMAGNVWEWTADWYGEYQAGASTNPTGPKEGTARVIRGGGWSEIDASRVRGASRFWDEPANRSADRGLRCAHEDCVFRLPSSLCFLSSSGFEDP